MAEIPLRKLSRKTLIELLHKQELEIHQLRGQVTQLQEELDRRPIVVNAGTEREEEAGQVVGSIAEAAFGLHEVFNVAQSAADQYLDEVKSIRKAAFKRAQDIETHAKQEAAQMLSEACLQQERLYAQREEMVQEVWEDLKAFVDENESSMELKDAVNDFLMKTKYTLGQVFLDEQSLGQSAEAEQDRAGSDFGGDGQTDA